jgi:hypothetical protein
MSDSLAIGGSSRIRWARSAILAGVGVVLLAAVVLVARDHSQSDELEGEQGTIQDLWNNAAYSNVFGNLGHASTKWKLWGSRQQRKKIHQVIKDLEALSVTLRCSHCSLPRNFWFAVLINPRIH